MHLATQIASCQWRRRKSLIHREETRRVSVFSRVFSPVLFFFLVFLSDFQLGAFGQFFRFSFRDLCWSFFSGSNRPSLPNSFRVFSPVFCFLFCFFVFPCCALARFSRDCVCLLQDLLCRNPSVAVFRSRKRRVGGCLQGYTQND